MALLHRSRLIPGGLTSWLARQSSSMTAENKIENNKSNAIVSNKRNDMDRRVLYRRLSAIRTLGLSRGAVSRALNEYIMEGNAVTKDELVTCIRELRKYGKFKQVFEIMEWMQIRKMNFSFSDHALYVDIISKVKGTAAAEDYFDGLPPPAKNKLTYGALLNSYCRTLMKNKAIELFEKMDELKFVSNSLPFNNLMTLYLKLGQPEKVISLVDEMKARNIIPCQFTYNIWMQSYATLNDIEGVERVFEDFSNSDVSNWTIYSTLASIYVKAELFEKAELVLKKMQTELQPRQREAYHFLISLYAGTSNLGEIYKSWDSLRLIHPEVNNLSYLVMLHALAKMQDIEGLTKLYNEWESNCSSFDARLPNVVLRVYLSKDMYSEAMLVFNNARKKCKGSFLRTREMFMVYYLKATRRLDLALEHLEETVKEDSNWIPRHDTVTAFFEYFQEEKDVDGAERFCKTLKVLNCLNPDYYRFLLKVYEAAGKVDPNMRKRLAEDGVEIDHELEELLQHLEETVKEDSNWIPRHDTVTAFFEYFQEEKDVDGAERFCKTLKVLNCLNPDYYRFLLKVYEAAGKVDPNMRKRLAEDGVEIDHELEELLQHLEETVKEDSNWIPRHDTVTAFFEYFQEEKDVDGAERFCKTLKVLNCLNPDYYRFLLKVYEAAGKVDPNMRKRLAEDGVEIDHELEELLQVVCPE